MRFSTVFSLCLMVIGISAAPITTQPLYVITPDVLTQCAPSTVTWSATHGPYYVQVLESNAQASFSSDQEMFMVPSNTATWIVDSPAGTNVKIMVRDASGQIAESYLRSVQPGSNSCLDHDLVV